LKRYIKSAAVITDRQLIVAVMSLW